jgi:hypothetical protein
MNHSITASSLSSESNLSSAERLAALRSRIQGLETAGSVDAPTRHWFPTPYKSLNECLPGGGLPQGGLVELLSAASGMGSLELALRLAHACLSTRPAWVLIDSSGDFYPAAMPGLGVDLARLIVMRAPARQSAWAFTQALRCRDVGAVIVTTRSMDNMQQRRFQLAAQRGGGIGFVLRPVEARRRACWAQVRLHVEAIAGADRTLRTRKWKIEVLHARGASGSAACDVEAT